jgi:peptide/nickel transport system substrate-binding protein
LWCFFVLALILFGWGWQRFFVAHSQWVPADGGIFTESTIGNTRNLNPLAVDQTLFDRDLRALLFAGLLRYDPVSGEILDGLGDFQISEDGKTYTLTLKHSARFADGKLVEVEDVLFTFEQVIQNPHFSNETLSQIFEYVTISVIDDRTIDFTLPEKNVFLFTF